MYLPIFITCLSRERGILMFRVSSVHAASRGRPLLEPSRLVGSGFEALMLQGSGAGA
jgi:hypothetical protein